MDDSKTAEKIFETELDDETISKRAVFTFKNTCQENTDIKLNDKSVKVIYNANAYENETE